MNIRPSIIQRVIHKVGASLISALICVQLILPPPNVLAQTLPMLPVPGSLVLQTPAFAPTLMRGLTVHPNDPFKFDFIIDPGESKLSAEDLSDEATKLMKYFLASLTVSESEMWVNLSPLEQNRIIPESFRQTQMGRDLLAQDYILKQLSASLMYPEKKLGQKFWKRVRSRAKKEFGTSEIPMNTFNKIWIVPSKAKIYVHENNVFVADSHLKVMLEEDYIALDHHNALQANSPTDSNVVSGINAEVVREILIPEIEKEVNQGELFANLRQIYHSMILATWYKNNLKQSLLSKMYVDQNKVKGVDIKDPHAHQKIYDQYLKAFKRGVYNYIKEEYEPETQQTIPRQYFAGGVDFDLAQYSEVETVNAIPLDGMYHFQTRIDAVTPEGVARVPVNREIDYAMFSFRPFADLIRSKFNGKNIQSLLGMGVLTVSACIAGCSVAQNVSDVRPVQGDPQVAQVYLGSIQEQQIVKQLSEFVGQSLSVSDLDPLKDVIEVLDAESLNEILGLYSQIFGNYKMDQYRRGDYGFLFEYISLMIGNNYLAEGQIPLLELNQVRALDVVRTIVTKYPILYSTAQTGDSDYQEAVLTIIEENAEKLKDAQDENLHFLNEESMTILTVLRWAQLVYYQNLSPASPERFNQMVLDALTKNSIFVNIRTANTTVDENGYAEYGRELLLMADQPEVAVVSIAHEQIHLFLGIAGLPGISNGIVMEMIGDVAGIQTVDKIYGSDGVKTVQDSFLYTAVLPQLAESPTDLVTSPMHFLARLQLQWIEEGLGRVDTDAMVKAVLRMNRELQQDELPAEVLAELKLPDSLVNISDESVYFPNHNFVKYLMVNYFIELGWMTGAEATAMYNQTNVVNLYGFDEFDILRGSVSVPNSDNVPTEAVRIQRSQTTTLVPPSQIVEWTRQAQILARQKGITDFAIMSDEYFVVPNWAEYIKVKGVQLPSDHPALAPDRAMSGERDALIDQGNLNSMDHPSREHFQQKFLNDFEVEASNVLEFLGVSIDSIDRYGGYNGFPVDKRFIQVGDQMIRFQIKAGVSFSELAVLSLAVERGIAAPTLIISEGFASPVLVMKEVDNEAKPLESVRRHKIGRAEQVTRAIAYSLGALHGLGYTHNGLLRPGKSDFNVDLQYREGGQDQVLWDQRRRYALFRNFDQASAIENDSERIQEIDFVKSRLKDVFSKWRFGFINSDSKFERVFEIEYVKGYSGIPADKGRTDRAMSAGILAEKGVSEADITGIHIEDAGDALSGQLQAKIRTAILSREEINGIQESGRSLIIPLMEDEYFEIEGRIIKGIRLKGVTHKGMPPLMQPYDDPDNPITQSKYNFQITTNSDGKQGVKFSRAPQQPVGALMLQDAINELVSLEYIQARALGTIQTDIPLGVGEFKLLKFNKQSTGFVILGLEQVYPATRVGSMLSKRMEKFPEARFYHEIMDGRHRDFVSDLKGIANTLADLHQVGLIHAAAHLDQFQRVSLGQVKVFDFEDSLFASDLSEDEYVFRSMRDFYRLLTNVNQADLAFGKRKRPSSEFMNAYFKSLYPGILTGLGVNMVSEKRRLAFIESLSAFNSIDQMAEITDISAWLREISSKNKLAAKYIARLRQIHTEVSGRPVDLAMSGGRKSIAGLPAKQARRYMDPDAQERYYRRFSDGQAVSKGGRFSYVAEYPRVLDAVANKIFSQTEPTDKILSVGEGQGHLAARLIKMGRDVTAIDVNAISNQLAQERGVPQTYGNAHDLPYAEGSFDVIYFSESIGNLDIPMAFKEANRVLKPGGKIIITTYPQESAVPSEVSPETRYLYYSMDEIQAALTQNNFQGFKNKPVRSSLVPDFDSYVDSDTMLDFITSFKTDQAMSSDLSPDELIRIILEDGEDLVWSDVTRDGYGIKNEGYTDAGLWTEYSLSVTDPLGNKIVDSDINFKVYPDLKLIVLKGYYPNFPSSDQSDAKPGRGRALFKHLFSSSRYAGYDIVSHAVHKARAAFLKMPEYLTDAQNPEIVPLRLKAKFEAPETLFDLLGKFEAYGQLMDRITRSDIFSKLSVEERFGLESDLINATIRLRVPELDSAMTSADKGQNDRIPTWTDVLNKGYSLQEGDIDYNSGWHTRTLKITDRDGRPLLGSDIRFDVYPEIGLIVLQSFYPNFPVDRDHALPGSGRVLFQKLFNSSQYAGYDIISEASRRARDSFLKMPEYLIDADNPQLAPFSIARSETLVKSDNPSPAFLKFRDRLVQSTEFADLEISQQLALRADMERATAHLQVPNFSGDAVNNFGNWTPQKAVTHVQELRQEIANVLPGNPESLVPTYLDIFLRPAPQRMFANLLWFLKEFPADEREEELEELLDEAFEAFLTRDISYGKFMARVTASMANNDEVDPFDSVLYLLFTFTTPDTMREQIQLDDEYKPRIDQIDEYKFLQYLAAPQIDLDHLINTTNTVVSRYQELIQWDLRQRFPNQSALRLFRGSENSERRLKVVSYFTDDPNHTIARGSSYLLVDDIPFERIQDVWWLRFLNSDELTETDIIVEPHQFSGNIYTQSQANELYAAGEFVAAEKDYARRATEMLRIDSAMSSTFADWTPQNAIQHAQEIKSRALRVFPGLNPDFFAGNFQFASRPVDFTLFEALISNVLRINQEDRREILSNQMGNLVYSSNFESSAFQYKMKALPKKVSHGDSISLSEAIGFVALQYGFELDRTHSTIHGIKSLPGYELINYMAGMTDSQLEHALVVLRGAYEYYQDLVQWDLSFRFPNQSSIKLFRGTDLESVDIDTYAFFTNNPRYALVFGENLIIANVPLAQIRDVWWLSEVMNTTSEEKEIVVSPNVSDSQILNFEQQMDAMAEIYLAQQLADEFEQEINRQQFGETDQAMNAQIERDVAGLIERLQSSVDGVNNAEVIRGLRAYNHPQANVIVETYDELLAQVGTNEAASKVLHVLQWKAGGYGYQVTQQPGPIYVISRGARLDGKIDELNKNQGMLGMDGTKKMPAKRVRDYIEAIDHMMITIKQSKQSRPVFLDFQQKDATQRVIELYNAESMHRQSAIDVSVIEAITKYLQTHRDLVAKDYFQIKRNDQAIVSVHIRMPANLRVQPDEETSYDQKVIRVLERLALRVQNYILILNTTEVGATETEIAVIDRILLGDASKTAIMAKQIRDAIEALDQMIVRINELIAYPETYQEGFGFGPVFELYRYEAVKRHTSLEGGVMKRVLQYLDAHPNLRANQRSQYHVREDGVGGYLSVYFGIPESIINDRQQETDYLLSITGVLENLLNDIQNYPITLDLDVGQEADVTTPLLSGVTADQSAHPEQFERPDNFENLRFVVMDNLYENMKNGDHSLGEGRELKVVHLQFDSGEEIYNRQFLRVGLEEDEAFIVVANLDGTNVQRYSQVNRVYSPDFAMSAQADQEWTKGGIDLDSSHLDIEVQGDAIEMSLPELAPNFDASTIEGFVPTILNVVPITNMPLLLGLTEDMDENKEQRAVLDLMNREENMKLITRLPETVERLTVQ